jgi:hypothetical protein
MLSLIDTNIWLLYCGSIETSRYAMFGLMVCDGMEWNGVVTNYVPLFGLAKSEWSGMEYNGTHSIPYHPILQFSIPPNLGCMQWNGAP